MHVTRVVEEHEEEEEQEEIVALNLTVSAPFQLVSDDPRGVGARCSAPANCRPELRSWRVDLLWYKCSTKAPSRARCSAPGAEEEVVEED